MLKESVESGNNKKLFVAQIVLLCVLLVFIVFGVTCTISKYVSVKNNNYMSIFNKTAITVADDNNAPAIKQDTNVTVSFTKNYNVGDYVIVDNKMISQYIYRIKSITRTSGNVTYSLVMDNSDAQMNVTKDRLTAKVVSKSQFVSGWIMFMLSGWILWLFVIIPSLILLMVFVLQIIINIRTQKSDKKDKSQDLIVYQEEKETESNLLEYNKPETKQIEQQEITLLEHKEILALGNGAQDEEEQVKVNEENIGDEQTHVVVEGNIEATQDSKKVKNKLLYTDEQNHLTQSTMFDAFDKPANEKIEGKSTDNSTVPILLDLEKGKQAKLAEKQNKNAKQAQKAKTEYKINLHKKRTKDKRDDYVFNKNLSLDTQPAKTLQEGTTKKEELNDNVVYTQESSNKSSIQSLLERMKRDSKK